MKKTQWKNILPCIWSTMGILIFSVILFLLYKWSNYLLFRLGGIFLLLAASVNLLLLIFGAEPRKKEANAESELPETQGSEAEEAPTADTSGRFSMKNVSWKKILKSGIQAVKNLFCKIYRPLQAILLLAVMVGCFIWFSGLAWSVPAPEIVVTLKYWHLVAVVALFVAAIILDKMCKHTETKTTFSSMLVRNARAFFALTKLIFAAIGLSLALVLLNIYDIKKYVIYVIAALFYYVVVMILFSLIVRFIRKEMSTSPGIVIILPFLNADIKELSVLSFLEENTGITLRSLWSIKYAKSILPYTILVAALLFWISTGIVYVQSHQEAAVYCLGSLQEKTLEPGLHLTLPYPLEKTDIYNTKTVNKMTIGYKSTENIDNVWTEAHGDSEYKLLLGSGNELVSINLRVEYRINDLKQYVSTATNPERIVEAKAYELITDRTINSDLDTMLSTDRETFATSFHQQLEEELEKRALGVEIVNVIMESIHPPVEVAKVYQDFIGAEIDAERLILDAQAKAAVTRAEGASVSREMLNAAKTNDAQQRAAANSEISEFMAALTASNSYPDEYAYYKYLNAICSAYQKARLVIVGDGVDGGRLYFGALNQN